MTKYIKAQDLIDRIYPVDPENDGSDGCTIVFQNLKKSSQEIEAIVDEIPAANVAPVVHAQWEKISEPDDDGNVWYRCPICQHNDKQSPGIDVPHCWYWYRCRHEKR